MANKTHKFKVEGIEYTLQKLPVREALKLKERCIKKGELVMERFYDELIEHVLISPKITVDDFEEVSELTEVINEIVQFQYMGKKKGKQK